MIIHQPETTHHDGEVIVATRVEFDTPNLPIPETLYFAVPERYAPLLTDRPEPFLTSLLVLPMMLREPVQVRGTLSPRLHYGLQMTMQAFNYFLPHELHVIEMTADHLTASNSDEMVTQGVSTLFSGSVDSLYTVWKHLPERQPLEQFRVTHALFAHGYDIPLNQTGRFNNLNTTYRDLLAKYNIDLVPVRTNVRDFTDLHHRYLSLKGAFGYNISFAALAQLFSKGIRTHYISASVDFTITHAQATHYAFDYQLGTETLSVYHDGTDRTRHEKTADIATWDDALKMLRVCSYGGLSNDEINCCRCAKCTRTMVRLALFDALHRTPTFPLPLTNAQILSNSSHPPHDDPAFFEDTLPLAAKRRPALLLPLLAAQQTRRAKRLRKRHPPIRFKRQRPPQP